MLSLEILLTALPVVGAAAGAIYYYLNLHFIKKISLLKEGHKIELAKASQHQQIENEPSKNRKTDTGDYALSIQEKLAYAKYIHITPRGASPAYRKAIHRLNKEIDVYSECYYLKFIRFNRPTSVTIRDRSSGVVDLALLHPWKQVSFADKASSKIAQMVTQELEGQDTYLAAATYYNGFVEGEEDIISTRMEEDATVVRMVADFSSVANFESLFVKPPDAWRIGVDEQKRKLLGLEQIKLGVYHIEVREVKKGEVVLLDLHVDWDRYGSAKE